MSTISVLFKLRRTLDDMGEVFSAQLEGDGATTIFELPEDRLDQTAAWTVPAAGGTQTMLVNGTDYVLDAYNGVISLTTPLPVGTILVVTGMTYTSWADADLTDYINQALLMHNVTRNPPVVLDAILGAAPPTNTVPLVEERGLAILAASLVVTDQATSVAKDITIDTGDGTVIPRGQRYQQLSAEAARLETQYVDLMERLGVPGFGTVSVTNLRRISYTTNRLVPEYVPREWDDRSFPQRVMPMIVTGAGEVDPVITYRGLWNPTTAYNINDLVDRQSARYLCHVANTGIDPVADVAAGGTNGVDGFNGQNWSLSYINSGNFGWAMGGW